MPILLFFYFLHCYWHYSYSIMYRGRLSQYQKSIDQTKISSATRNNQNQSDALQKQIESYTRKFQQEKRKLFRAQQNHRQVLKDYKNQVKDLESLKSSVYQTQMINLSAKIKCLQVNLQNGIASYNEALSRNNMLKAEIEELRKDKKNQKQAFKTLGQKIEELNSSISAMDQNIQTKRKKVEKTKEQILSLRQKNQKQNEEYIKYVEVLKENQSLMRDSLKNNGAKQITETSDTQPIVKLRIRNLMHQNKQKIKIAEMYKRSMEKIQQSFDQIKKESGIHDLEQITKTFLKQEEQNTLIFQYINKLTVELETIREDNQKISNKIVKHQQIMNQHKSLIGGSPEEQKQRVKVQLYCQEKQKHIDRLNNFLHAIQPCLLNALNIQNKQAAGIISHSNIQAYLAMLQQKITKKCAREESENPSAQVKQQYTKYSKPLPTFTVEEVKQKAQETIMQQPKFRDYASQFWEKKKLNK